MIDTFHRILCSSEEVESADILGEWEIGVTLENGSRFVISVEEI